MSKVIIGVEEKPRVQFTMDVGDELPTLLRLPDGSLIVHRGKYASPGERHSYRRVNEPVDVAVPVKEWAEYTSLEG